MPMKKSTDIKRFLVGFILVCSALVLLVELRVVERFSYTIEKGRLRAQREALPTQEQAAEHADLNRRLVNTVLPTVVSIETERFDPIAEVLGPDFSEDPVYDWLFPDPGVVPKGLSPRDETEGSPPRIDLGLGSGVIVDAKQGLVLTNAHVVEGAGIVRVYTSDGRMAKAEILGADSETDLAVLRVNLPNLHALPMGDSEKLAVGDDVMAVGNPFGLEGTVSKGIVSGLHRRNVRIGGQLQPEFIQTDALVSPGSSGGPLVNMQGEIIGINTALASRNGRYEGVGFAVPTALVRERMDDLVSGGPAFLGVLVTDAAEGREAEQAIVVEGEPALMGARVEALIPGHPAEEAGLQPNDIIVGIDGESVDSMSQLGRLLSERRAGAVVAVRLQRGAEELTIPVRVTGRFRPQ